MSRITIGHRSRNDDNTDDCICDFISSFTCVSRDNPFRYSSHLDSVKHIVTHWAVESIWSAHMLHVCEAREASKISLVLRLTEEEGPTHCSGCL